MGGGTRTRKSRSPGSVSRRYIPKASRESRGKGKLCNVPGPKGSKKGMERKSEKACQDRDVS